MSSGFLIGIIFSYYLGYKAGSTIYKTFLVKFITAFSLLLLFYKYSFSISFFLFAFFVYSLISVSVVDYFHKIIPAVFPILMVIFGVIFSFFNVSLGENIFFRFVHSLQGILVGAGSLFVVSFLGDLIYKKEVIGFGDVKLMAGVGAFIGCQRILFAIFIAAVLASIVGFILIIIKRITRKDYIAFGPFLSLGSFLTVFLPQPSILIDKFFFLETQLLTKLLGA
ncbi:MAG: A24 family peptidase [Endomicrobium sp.]|jgi:leader peptidase (prepilin peptidase)/N-methyltransferase|uniref:prepilin peptidase n=1 Tax=Candidatus Endomicrobiellum cubanum TaxID=3242325 RepID=UPI002831E593|nr:A24 family peptidase [Endomicrobium sp.]MDR2396225.1 A24 family peptidase [Endomicrobium sp.]